jgi:hypothetical protein
MTTSYEKPVTLPGGGTAWVATMLSHAQATTLRLNSMRISRFVVPVRGEEGETTQDWRGGLSAAQEEERDRLVLDTSALHVRTITTRWSGVKDRDGNELAFPEDIERMTEDDFQALFTAATEARSQDADPNA